MDQYHKIEDEEIAPQNHCYPILDRNVKKNRLEKTTPNTTKAYWQKLYSHLPKNESK